MSDDRTAAPLSRIVLVEQRRQAARIRGAVLDARHRDRPAGELAVPRPTSRSARSSRMR
jgi:hypothetical protein